MYGFRKSGMSEKQGDSSPTPSRAKGLMKKEMCVLLRCRFDLRISGRQLTYIIRHSKRHLKAVLPMLIWAILV